MEPSQLASDTAHLLTKWSLRCLVEDSYDENRTKEFLHWVKKAVIKHKTTVDVVLLEPGLKADLLRLHHQAFEAQCHSSMSARVETFQLFTNIMIHLLETQGHLPELHQAVISACLPEATLDQSRHGKSRPPLSQTASVHYKQYFINNVITLSEYCASLRNYIFHSVLWNDLCCPDTLEFQRKPFLNIFAIFNDTNVSHDCLSLCFFWYRFRLTFFHVLK